MGVTTGNMSFIKLSFYMAATVFMLVLTSGQASAAKCGAANQRPCKVWERVPSCNKGLYEDFKKNRCRRRKRIVCGGNGQRPCKVWERVPSCNKGLYENFKLKRCMRRKKIICGGNGQRPCKVWERVPSCNPGLGENFKTNRCQRLKKGQSAFFFGVGSAAGEIANLEKVCHSIVGLLPPLRTGISGFDKAANCQFQYQVGFRCAAPMVFEKVASTSNLGGRLEAALNAPECRKLAPPLRTFCSIGSVVNQAAIQPARCLAKIMLNGGFQDVAGGSQQAMSSLCRDAGRLSFEIALDRLLRKRNKLKGYKRTLFKAAKKARKYSKKAGKIDAFFQKIAREPACRGVLN